MSDSEITVRAPGKPDSQQKVANGQLRLQSAGYVHSTSIDGATAYRNVTVELLAPQQSPRNLCAAVILGQPINCPESSPQHEAHGASEQPQFQTNETKVTLIRILRRQSATLDTQGLSQLLVVLDDVGISDSDNNPRKILHTGDFLCAIPGVRRTFLPTIAQTRYVLFPSLFNKKGLLNDTGWLAKSMKCDYQHL